MANVNEITKLYENAGVEPKAKCNSGACIVTNPSKTWCKQCESLDYTYPPFTAEKQIELIKWLARKGLIQINYSSHQCYQFNSFRVGGDYKTEISEALASHCNNLWQDLTEEERKQIKEILE